MNIQNISIDLIDPHPDNPRKDLGDLTELVNSIKESGIFQNLTVVRNDERYTCIMGHRRLAASKLAGLKELPCAVVEMDYKTQLSNMLVENMQRSDLTLLEEAQGIQLMFDIGFNYDEVAKQTGFSESTISHRRKIAELDGESLKKAFSTAQPTIGEFIKLEKIEDINERNRLLKVIGTVNFDKWYASALEEQKGKANIQKWLEWLEENATELKKDEYERAPYNYTLICYFSKRTKFDEDKMPTDTDKTKYYYVLDEKYGSHRIFRELNETERAERANRAEDEKRQRELEQRRNQLKEVSEKAKNLRESFMKSYVGKPEDERELFKLFKKHCSKGYIDIFPAAKCKSLNGAMLYIIYFSINQYNSSTYTWQCKFQESESLNKQYELLKTFGYQMTDEESSLLDGTHELFIKES